jgi:hypothetical protein
LRNDSAPARSPFSRRTDAEIGEADGRFPVLVAEHLAPDAERLALQRFGALVEPLVLIRASELHQRNRDVRRAPAEKFRRMCDACSMLRTAAA